MSGKKIAVDGISKSFGNLEVVKDVTLPPETGPQKIRFTGDISFANNEFFLTSSNTSSGRMSFIRAAGRTWSFREDPTPLGTLTAMHVIFGVLVSALAMLELWQDGGLTDQAA